MLLSHFNTLSPPNLFAVKEKWYRQTLLLKNEAGECYGRISYRGFFYRTAIAETAEATWTFHESGIFGKVVHITDESGEQIAEFKRRWLGHKGVLTLRNEKQITYSASSIWATGFSWNDPERGEVIKLRQKVFSWRSIRVEITDDVRSNPLLPLLTLFGVYNIQVDRRKHAAAST